LSDLDGGKHRARIRLVATREGSNMSAPAGPTFQSRAAAGSRRALHSGRQASRRDQAGRSPHARNYLTNEGVMEVFVTQWSMVWVPLGGTAAGAASLTSSLLTL
jgi:hypothetical protein